MKRFLFLLLFVLYGCEGASEPEATDPLSVDSMLLHLGALADDSMLGRRAGSPQELLAANYVRDMFTAYGLQAGATGFLQEFTFADNDVLQVLAPGAVAGSVPHAGGWDGVPRGEPTSKHLAGVFQDVYSTQNVLGAIAGRGALADEWVIVGAHYDHVGFHQVEPESVVVFNGADDNGSGTALLLEIARYLRHYLNAGVGQSLDRRSIMFVAFGAEEAGLLGSWHFIQNPPSTVERTDITAMVNLDMVGRLRSNRLYAFGAYTSDLWVPLLEENNVDGLELVVPTSVSRGSDHYPFYEHHIPVLSFYTGTHDQYHQPEDDVDLINAEGMVRIGNLAIEVLLELLVREQPPVWVN